MTRVKNQLQYAWVLLACLVATPVRAAMDDKPMPGAALDASDDALLKHHLLTPPVVVAVAPPHRRGPKGRVIDVEVHGGAIIPGAEFYQHAKTSGFYGAGLGKEFTLSRHTSLRGTVAYSRAQLPAKPAGLTGHVTLNMVALRVDLLVLPGRVRPFVGAGLGVYPWRGKIRQPASDLTNSRVATDFGGLVSAGVDIRANRHLSLSPELSWTRITGDFSQMFWNAALAARWRF